MCPGQYTTSLGRYAKKFEPDEKIARFVKGQASIILEGCTFRLKAAIDKLKKTPFDVDWRSVSEGLESWRVAGA